MRHEWDATTWQIDSQTDRQTDKRTNEVRTDDKFHCCCYCCMTTKAFNTSSVRIVLAHTANKQNCDFIVVDSIIIFYCCCFATFMFPRDSCVSKCVSSVIFVVSFISKLVRSFVKRNKFGSIRINTQIEWNGRVKWVNKSEIFDSAF